MAEKMPNWMKRFHQQDSDEEKDEEVHPVKLLDPKGRSFVWWLSRQYGAMPDGVMGQACSLLERYMSKKINKSFSCVPPSSARWHQMKDEIANRIPLLVSVCISLTTKMMSSTGQVHPKTICDVLGRLIGPITLEQINVAELDVLSTLGFCIPLFTNVEKALMMANEVGMTGLLLEGVSIITEVAEYYRSVIQEEIIAIASSMSGDKTIMSRSITNIHHLHLVAGAVLATSQFFAFSGPDCTPRLSFLTRSSQMYIKCIGDLIYKHLVGLGPLSPMPSRKRKIDTRRE